MTHIVDARTDAEVAAHVRNKCANEGHLWKMLMDDGVEDPVGVLCDRCGRHVTFSVRSTVVMVGPYEDRDG